MTSVSTAVLLDVGGVIVLPDFTPVAVALDGQGRYVAKAALERAHYVTAASIDDAYATGSRNLIDAYVQGFLDALGDPQTGPDVARAIETAFTTSWSTTIDSTLDAMRTLHARGHPIGIVSNSLGHVEEGLRGICQVGEGPGAVVDAMIDSFRVGVQKPDPRIFEMALSAIGAEARDAIHVGDTIAYDVRGAQAAGIRAFHLDPWMTCPGSADHAHIASVTELVDLLRP